MVVVVDNPVVVDSPVVVVDVVVEVVDTVVVADNPAEAVLVFAIHIAVESFVDREFVAVVDNLVLALVVHIVENNPGYTAAAEGYIAVPERPVVDTFVAEAAIDCSSIEVVEVMFGFVEMRE